MEQALQHFGVLGMKWGIRKKRPTNQPTTTQNSIANSVKSKVSDSDLAAIKKTYKDRIDSSKNSLAQVAKKYGKLEAAERVDGHAYEDTVYMMKQRYGEQKIQKRYDEALAVERSLMDDYYNHIDKLKHDSMAAGEDFLQHFGVLGMKWGVRKKRESGGGNNGSSGKGPSEDFIKTRSLRTTSTSEMSNDEMKDLINRLNMERQIAQLRRTKGQDFMENLALRTANTVADNLIKSGYKRGLDQMGVSQNSILRDLLKGDKSKSNSASSVDDILKNSKKASEKAKSKPNKESNNNTKQTSTAPSSQSESSQKTVSSISKSDWNSFKQASGGQWSSFKEPPIKSNMPVTWLSRGKQPTVFDSEPSSWKPSSSLDTSKYSDQYMNELYRGSRKK